MTRRFLEIEKIEGKFEIKSKRSKFILSALDAKTFPLMEAENESILSKHKSIYCLIL